MKKYVTVFLRSVRTGLQKLCAFAVSPMTWLLLLAFSGAAAVTAGVHVLFGDGIALICGGVFSLLFAFIIFRGLGKEG